MLRGGAGSDVRPEDLVVAGLCFLGAAVALADALPRYSGRAGAVGPGAFPTWVGVFLALCGLLMAIKAARSGVGSWAAWPRGRALYRVGAAVGAMGAYLVLLPHLGFGVATFLFMVLFLRGLGVLPHRWWDGRVEKGQALPLSLF